MFSGGSFNLEFHGDLPLEEPSPLAARLSRIVSLSKDEYAALDQLPAEQQTLPAGHVLSDDAVWQDGVCLHLRGIAFRFQVAPSGGRQILGFIVPGDLIDPYFATLEAMDHKVALLGECVLMVIPRQALLSVLERFPNIEHGIFQCAVQEQNILREWLLNMGQRSALERVSHFLGEMAFRLRSVDMANPDDSVDLPISRSLLADTTGLTLMHINRILQHLRDQKLVEIGKRRITIISVTELLATLGFEADYLYG